MAGQQPILQKEQSVLLIQKLLSGPVNESTASVLVKQNDARICLV